MPPGTALALGGLVLTSFGLYQLGWALTAASTPYGFGLVIAAICLLLGAGLLAAAWREAGRVTARAVAVVSTMCLLALTLGLLQLPSDDLDDGSRCRALNGNVYDCDDPRIDEPQEKAAVVD